MTDLDAVYRQYADTVFRFLLVKTGSADLAEELTQETLSGKKIGTTHLYQEATRRCVTG